MSIACFQMIEFSPDLCYSQAVFSKPAHDITYTAHRRKMEHGERRCGYTEEGYFIFFKNFFIFKKSL